MHSEQVDGMDVMAVREAMDRAVDIARDRKEPTFLEVNTYRYVKNGPTAAVDPTGLAELTREKLEEALPLAKLSKAAYDAELERGVQVDDYVVKDFFDGG